MPAPRVARGSLAPTRAFDGHEEIIGGLLEEMGRQGEFIERSGL
jgi:hypothetical protein